MLVGQPILCVCVYSTEFVLRHEAHYTENQVKWKIIKHSSQGRMVQECFQYCFMGLSKHTKQVFFTQCATWPNDFPNFFWIVWTYTKMYRARARADILGGWIIPPNDFRANCSLSKVFFCSFQFFKLNETEMDVYCVKDWKKINILDKIALIFDFCWIIFPSLKAWNRLISFENFMNWKNEKFCFYENR